MLSGFAPFDFGGISAFKGQVRGRDQDGPSIHGYTAQELTSI